MVKDLFVDFDTFVAQVMAVEGEPFCRFIKDWAIEEYTLSSPNLVNYTSSYFLPYPYQFGYMAKRLQDILTSTNPELTRNYADWYSDWYHNCKSNNGIDSLSTKAPLFIPEGLMPSWEEVYKYRISPFILNSITSEEYHDYSDCKVLINLDRNNHVILTNGKDTGEIIKCIIPDKNISPRISFFMPACEKIWFKYKNGKYKNGFRKFVNLGDADYGMLDKKIIEHYYNTTGNVYLFDNNNLG